MCILHSPLQRSYLNLKLLGGIFEFKITTVKLWCVFLDKHKRHILQSYNARTNNRFLLSKSTKMNQICRFLESVSSDHNYCQFYIRQYFKQQGILDLCFDHKLKYNVRIYHYYEYF